MVSEIWLVTRRACFKNMKAGQSNMCSISMRPPVKLRDDNRANKGSRHYPHLGRIGISGSGQPSNLSYTDV